MTEMKFSHRDKEAICKKASEVINNQVDFIDKLEKYDGCGLLVSVKIEVVR